MTEQLSSRPALLRWWRTVHAGLGLDALARATGTATSTVHNWETGNTDGPDIGKLALLDARMSGDGTLGDLYTALRTPDALDASSMWRFNFQGESRPCWAWIRIPGDMPVLGRVIAGPFSLDLTVPPDVGIFVQSYALANNPPVEITLTVPGWADFGYGEIPPGIGAPVIDAISVGVINPATPLDPALLVATNAYLPDRFGGRGWFETLKQRLDGRIERVRKSVPKLLKAPITTRSDLRSAEASHDPVPAHWGADRYQHLRAARGLSLNDLAVLASRLQPDFPPVTRDHIYRLEHGSAPRVTDLLPRLDMALRADGRTCTVELDAAAIQPVRGGVELTFPSYWIGPVWIQFRQHDALAKPGAQLVWKPWHKSLVIRDGVVVTTRRSTSDMASLKVNTPEGWSVHAGLGVHPRAVDVNGGWGLIPTLAYDTLTQYLHVVEKAFRKPTTDSADAPSDVGSGASDAAP